MTIEDDVRRARKLFRDFHGRDPKPDEIMTLGPPRGAIVVLEVGTLVSLGYKANGDGETYYHEFEGSKPRLLVTPDGRQAYIVAGSYTFTDRGFIK